MLKNALIALAISLVLGAIGAGTSSFIAYVMAGIFFVMFVGGLVMHLVKKV